MKRMAKWVGAVLLGAFCLGLFTLMAERFLLPQPDPAELFENVQTLALARAFVDRDGPAFDALLEAGADIDARDRDGLTMLQWRVLRGDHSGTRWLLQRGADPNLRGYFGETALHSAAARDHPGVLTLLLDHGGDPNVSEERLTASPIFTALMARRDKTLAVLIDRGADIEFADSTGSRPLMLAAAINASDAVIVLLRNGADPLATNDLGFDFQPAFFKTDPALLNISARWNRDWVIAFLRERGICLHPSAYRGDQSPEPCHGLLPSTEPG